MYNGRMKRTKMKRVGLFLSEDIYYQCLDLVPFYKVNSVQKVINIILREKFPRPDDLTFVKASDL